MGALSCKPMIIHSSFAQPSAVASKACRHARRTDGCFVLLSESSDNIKFKTCIFLHDLIPYNRVRTVASLARFEFLYNNVCASFLLFETQ